MDFYEVVDQVVQLLQQRGRLTYRSLKLQFKLDDETLEALKEEILYAHPQVVDDEGRGLLWTGEANVPPEPAPSIAQTAQPEAVSEVQSPQAKPSPEPPTPDAERRQLTVMFCDLADSTKLSGQLDPEDLRDVIRAYQETAAGVILRYEGHIAQYLGDGLLVYFGWPQAHEDDAQRSIHAGLGIIDAMATLNTQMAQDKGVRLTLRIGIHTGPVVIGEMGGGGRHEQLALGETTNIAARLEGMAQPNTVVISDATYRLIEGYFNCHDLGTHALKGVATPMPLYQVRQTTGIQGRLDTAMRRGLTPLVGREQEVGMLLERWVQVKEGQGQVVLLSGEAGIGKSRLAQVLKDHIADEPHTRLECRSSPYYQNSALYPMTDLFQRTLQWQQDDTPAQRLERLEHTLSASRLPLEDTVPLLAALLSLPLSEDQYPPLQLTPQRQRQKTLETLVAMLLEQAERQPVLFILEDLHWTDPTTLDWLTLLVEQVPTTSLLIVLTCRPAFQSPWGLRSHLTPIALNRFTQGQIETMASGMTGAKSLPAEVVQHLVEKTDGVPLYVEEMLKAILEAGILQESDGRYTLTGPLASLAIPATLQDSLMARLDRLETAKSTAQLGAVLGRQFSYEVLKTVSQLDDATLQRELDRLVEAELLYQRGLSAQATYIFKHALIQDTAYQTLLRRTRQEYHQRIAQALTEHFAETAETQPELLAHHYTEAGLRESAVAYWQRAGDLANTRSAHQEAIHHLENGLTVIEALPETPKRIEHEISLQIALGQALMHAKGQGIPDVERAFSRAYELCRQVGESPQLFPVLWGLWRFYHIGAKYRTALELGEQCLSLAQQVQDPALLIPSHFALGGTLQFVGEFARARAHLEQGIALYVPQEHRELAFRYGLDLKVWCLSYGAWPLWLMGYPDQALRRSHEALSLAQELAHPLSIAGALDYASFVNQFRREAPMTQERTEAAMALAREHGFPQYEALGLPMWGWALAQQGHGEAGIDALRQGMAAHLVVGAQLIRPYFLAMFVEAIEDKPEEGLVALDEALTLVETTEERWWEAELYRLKGVLLQRVEGDVQSAELTPETCFQQALDIACHQQAKSFELRAATSLARLWQSQDKRQEAYDLLAPVYEWFTEGFDTADLKDAKALLDELEG